MNLQQAIELKHKIKALPGFTLPVNGVKIKIGNGFIAWRGADSHENECLFVNDKGKSSQTVFWATVVDGRDGWELRNSYLKTGRLFALVATLQTFAEELAKEEAKAKTETKTQKLPDLEPTPVLNEEPKPEEKHELEMPALESDDDEESDNNATPSQKPQSESEEEEEDPTNCLECD
jgi:hypothetical protein